MKNIVTTGDFVPGAITVVITAWNNWPDLDMAIASALHQSLPPLEVIVVDNSSTDATQEEVKRRYLTRVRCVVQPNSECAGAHNTGFSLARGEYIQFLAGDDVLAPNKLAKQIEVFRANPELDIVYGDIRMFRSEAGVAYWSDVPTRQEEDMLSALILSEKLGAGINTLGTLFHRRALEKVGPWDGTIYCEDTDYWLRAAWCGCRFGYCPGSPMGFKRMWAGQKMADDVASSRGLEAVWAKALGYVTSEPYRSLLADRLAEYRYFLAISRDYRNRSEAIAKLKLARATSERKISSMTYAFGYAAIVLPGGKMLVRSRKWRWIRQSVASFLRFRLT